jgi:23S rRNA (cytidine1920-2'-O)/16S rRNA (cytidine1409-2'-O)-methyltransferase
MAKKRIDLLLVQLGLFDTRSKAQSAIMAGVVFANGKKTDKAGEQVEEGAKIEVKGDASPYVGRGGVKLEHALKVFDIDVKERAALDIGASTGGFTDCLLKRGARLVYAVDVGYGQIAWSLRKDPRVVVVERTNARYLRPEELYSVKGKGERVSGEKASLAVIDVSFISLSKVLPAVCDLLSDDGEVVALVKPQFEAGREQVEKGGLVKDKKVQAGVLEAVVSDAKKLGLKFAGATFSPITGADGNIEFFVHLSKLGENKELDAFKIIEEAWQKNTPSVSPP